MSAVTSIADASVQSAEEWAGKYNQWDTPSARLSTPLSRREADTELWHDDAKDLLRAYQGERVNRYGNGFIGRANAKYARIKDGDRHIHQSTDDYYTVMFTLGGRVLDEDNEYRPPLDFHDDLLESRSEVRKRLKRIQNRCGGMGFFEVVSGNGPHAYSHLHIFAFFREKVDKGTFEPIRSAHTEHSPVARDINPDNYITIEHSSDLSYEPQNAADMARGPVCGGTTYLATQIPHIGGEDAPINQIEHSAVCRNSSEWDTYLSPRYADHAECERTEREYARKKRVGKVRAYTSRDPTKSTQNNLLVLTESTIPVLSKLTQFGSDPIFLCLNQTFLCSYSSNIPSKKTSLYLLWLYRYRLPS